MRLRVAEMASYFGIADWFERDVAALSGGQKQMLNLASVVVMRPDVLILDEPTSQLDPIAASTFLHTLRKLNEELGLTILCSLGNFDTLITGDMDAKTETKLVETYDLPDIEVLLVGHHGSKYSTGTTLLESVTPEAGVISVGDNSYGHPTEEALLRLTDAGMTVYRTDMQGNILITVD